MFLFATFPHPGPDGFSFNWLEEVNVLLRKKLKRFLTPNLGLGVEPLPLFQPRGIASILGKVAGLSGWAAINARHALLIEHLVLYLLEDSIGPFPINGFGSQLSSKTSEAKAYGPDSGPLSHQPGSFPPASHSYGRV